MARFVLVWTRFGMSGVMAMTPWGPAYRNCTTRSASAASSIRSRFEVWGSNRIWKSGSAEPSSERMSASSARSACSTAATCPGSSATVTKVSRGMALRLEPPVRVMMSTVYWRRSVHRIRAASLMALPRPVAMSSPEWPPFSPATFRR